MRNASTSHNCLPAILWRHIHSSSWVVAPPQAHRIQQHHFVHRACAASLRAAVKVSVRYTHFPPARLGPDKYDQKFNMAQIGIICAGSRQKSCMDESDEDDLTRFPPQVWPLTAVAAILRASSDPHRRAKQHTSQHASIRLRYMTTDKRQGSACRAPLLRPSRWTHQRRHYSVHLDGREDSVHERRRRRDADRARRDAQRRAAQRCVPKVEHRLQEARHPAGGGGKHVDGRTCNDDNVPKRKAG